MGHAQVARRGRCSEGFCTRPTYEALLAREQLRCLVRSLHIKLEALPGFLLQRVGCQVNRSVLSCLRCLCYASYRVYHCRYTAEELAEEFAIAKVASRPWAPVNSTLLASVRGGGEKGGSRVFHKNLGPGRVVSVYEPNLVLQCASKFRSMITVPRLNSELKLFPGPQSTLRQAR